MDHIKHLRQTEVFRNQTAQFVTSLFICTEVEAAPSDGQMAEQFLKSFCELWHSLLDIMKY